MHHDLEDLFPCFFCLLPVFSLLLLSVRGLGVRVMATVKASFNCHVGTLEEKVGSDHLNLLVLDWSVCEALYPGLS